MKIKIAAISVAAATAAATALGTLALPSGATAQLYPAPGYTAPASPATVRFIAVATTTSNFIDQSSRLAMGSSPTAGIRGFARQAIIEENRAHNVMTAWADVAQPMLSGRSAYTPDAVAGTPLALAVNSGIAVSGERILPTSDGTAVTAEQFAMLNQLANLRGRDFDGAYLRHQIDAHQRLLAAYQTYATSGDDAALQRMARAEIPRLQSDLRRLSAF
jgi:predicted outer membrane protein